MPSDYSKIKSENERRYGTDIGRIGPMLLANRYDDRTHFIFELLQNAEDALARRSDWAGSRAVNFSLSKDVLQVSHFGKPFDDSDVRGICGIAASTKDLTAIGRFGIGFKSVYAFTDCPEIHSGGEDFAIESYVWPAATQKIDRVQDETIILLPLKSGDSQAAQEIAKGLQSLGPRALLFLRQIEEIGWSVKGGPAGLYLRSKPEAIGENVRRITVIGQEEGKPDIEETWLVFSREVRSSEGGWVGQAEIAFSIAQDQKYGPWPLQAVNDSPLIVFFPTVVPTHLGFLVQGPYRTTPSRDNVPRSDPWNQYLIGETSALLIDALRWLRDQGMLDTGALCCLPLDRTKFGEGSMFGPLFEAVRTAMTSEPLLPRFGGGNVPASQAKLGRTQELRELFAPSQLSALFGANGGLAWLSSDITQDRMPELRQYLMHELEITEVTPETILPKLDKTFLEAQPDKWLLSLYEFLNGQPKLQRRLNDTPLIRVQDGTHVVAYVNNQPQAFLPGTIETAFPTVRGAVCATETARDFLRSVGLTEPDPVDDVVWNILPKYRNKGEVDIKDEDYESNIRRILSAFGTDSKAKRDKLLTALRESFFIRAVDTGDGSKYLSKPGDLYLATQRLKELFRGISGVLLVDDTYPCLRGEEVRDLLEACGATRHLQLVPVYTDFTWKERAEMRTKGGCQDSSREYPIEDFTLRGLNELLEAFPALHSQQTAKAELLWDALSDVEDRRGTRAFSAIYRWFYVNLRQYQFDAAFIRQLNETAWVPDREGQLQPPNFVAFEETSWKPHPFLLTKIRFKPPIIEALAREAGIELGVINLLKKHGVTSVAELAARLGIGRELKQPGPDNVNDAVKNILGDTPGPIRSAPDSMESELQGAGGGGGGFGYGTGSAGVGTLRGSTGGNKTDGKSSTTGTHVGKRTPGSVGGRPFISYVATHAEDPERDPDDLDQSARIALEEKAIGFIIESEPNLHRTPTHNPGFDLIELDGDGQTIRWIEVKGMTGNLQGRPVGLSRTQFECAREKGLGYWLYVVEQAGNPQASRMVRIQDPAGKAKTFTFDHGWLDVAEISGYHNSEVEQEGASDSNGKD